MKKAVEANESGNSGYMLVKVDEAVYGSVQQKYESLPLVFQLDDGTQTSGVIFVRREGHVVMLDLRDGIID